MKILLPVSSDYCFLGANCSQAIMLVTDGVQYNYKEIFQKYNWGALPDHMNARVFTYLIGREVSDVRDVKWMACANQGTRLQQIWLLSEIYIHHFRLLCTLEYIR